MSLAHDVAKLMTARAARAAHIAARPPVDETTRRARLASILLNPKPGNLRHARVVDIFARAAARRDHQGIA